MLLTLLCLAMSLPGLSGMQVIDRDEARFAQASMQMAESGDLINIEFQDEARNKKPSGIYWLQTAAIKSISGPGERDIWVQRIPSVLGVLLAILMTYRAGIMLIGRQGAMVAGGLLALSILVVFEAHNAKTDAVLFGLAACIFAAIAGIRHTAKTRFVWLFWIAIGLSVLIKGPVLIALAALCIGALLIWERDQVGLKPLLNWPAIMLCLLMTVPWAIMMWVATDGAFFVESLANDFGGKLVSAQEKHGGPPGYHLVFIWPMFWPGSLLLLPGFAFAIRALRNAKKIGASGQSTTIVRAMRLCLAWIIPFWLLIEIMPTKLPHYALPLYPALAVMCGGAAITLMSMKEFPVTRRLGALIYLILTAALIALITLIHIFYDGAEFLGPWGVYGLGAVVGIFAIAGSFSIWMNKIRAGFICISLSAVILSTITYHFLMPGLNGFRLADRIQAQLETENITLPRHGGPEFLSPQFTEPSLVYRLGREIKLGETADPFDIGALKNGRIILIDLAQDKGEAMFDALSNEAKSAALCLDRFGEINGANYANGDQVELVLLRSEPCDVLAADPNVQ